MVQRKEVKIYIISRGKGVDPGPGRPGPESTIGKKVPDSIINKDLFLGPN